MTNELILLVNFKAKGQVVDHRGAWAEQLSAHMGLPHWGISLDGIEVRNAIEEVDLKLRAFLDPKQCCLHMRDIDNADEFNQKTRRFFEWLFKQPEIGSTLDTQRVGVRGRFLAPFGGTFNELRVRFETRYLSITPEAQTALAATGTIDVGAPWHFEDELGRFNTQCGPTDRVQAKLSFFPYKKAEALPKVGLYFDNDYFEKPERPVKAAYLEQFISQGASQAWQRFDRIKDLMLSGDSRLEQTQIQAAKPTSRIDNTRQGSVIRRLFGAHRN